MSRMVWTSHDTARGTIARDVTRDSTGPALRQAASLAVGLAVVAAMFADLAKVSVVPMRVSDASSVAAPED